MEMKNLPQLLIFGSCLFSVGSTVIVALPLCSVDVLESIDTVI